MFLAGSLVSVTATAVSLAACRVYPMPAEGAERGTEGAERRTEETERGAERSSHASKEPGEQEEGETDRLLKRAA